MKMLTEPYSNSYFHFNPYRSLVCEDEKQDVVMKSQLQQLARPMYSNPPVHGAFIVSTILGDPDLKQLWLKHVEEGMADRIIGMRTSLRENIEKLVSLLSWEHITNQIGMFCCSGMTPEQVDCLKKEFHIYIVVAAMLIVPTVVAGHAYCFSNYYDRTKKNCIRVTVKLLTLFENT
ncbi:putative aspartate aminotransferase, class I/classII [Helianthus debilis subsp. tardiflorus]